MYDLNRATIIGRLTRDPELRSLTTGTQVATMGVATSRVWTDKNGQKQKEAEFHNVVMWSKMGAIAAQYLKKGQRVYIEGRLRTREWTGQDGVKRYRTEIIAENMIMLDGPRGSATPGATGADYGGAPTYQPIEDMGGSSHPAEVVEEEIKVEDIPF